MIKAFCKQMDYSSSKLISTVNLPLFTQGYYSDFKNNLLIFYLKLKQIFWSFPRYERRKKWNLLRKKTNFNFWKLHEWLPGIDRGLFFQHFYHAIWLENARISTTVLWSISKLSTSQETFKKIGNRSSWIERGCVLSFQGFSLLNSS